MKKYNLGELFSGCSEETLPVKDGSKEESSFKMLGIAADTDFRSIINFCQENRLQIPAFFTTAFALALKSYTASEDAFFTCINDGKMAAIHLVLEGKEKVADEIRRCEEFLEAASQNEDYSFEELAGKYNLSGTVCLTLGGGHEIDPAAKLFLRVLTDDRGITWECEYDASVFSEYTAKGLVRLLDNITGELPVKECLKDVSLTTKDDEEKILNIYDASSPYEDKPGYRHLQDSAEKYPDRTALIAIDRTLTYKELNEEANALGHVLRDNGAGIETRVAVLADRNSYGYVMREGALKSGGAFMPIDPDYPEERIMFILEDSGCKILVTTKEIMDRRKELMESLGAAGVTVIDVTKAVTEGNRDNLNIDVPGEALAYVIYTSGSTGKPKGVMIENRNLANFVDDNIHNKEVRVFTKFGRVTLAIAAFTFDVSVLEEFVPLGHGQTVVLATMDQIMDAQQMRALILNNNVESMTCTPTYMLNLTEIESFAPAIRNLKSIDIGSEAFPPVLYTKLAAINPDLYICNSYGPTECSVTCTLKELNCVEDLSIGYPLSNVKLATFDRDGRLQVPGALGELVIMGNGVGRGYIGRDDLNKRNFITLLGLPAYRSGDLVRIKEDGDVEFHGRIDNQVKLRGLRVELGEIESVLGNYPGIRSCIVIVAKGETDYLAAYFTADEKVDIKSLKAHLSSYLTSYMVPQAFLQLDEMPMNLSGKIDKKALPEAVMTEDEIVPPENETQEKILQVVKEVIGDVNIGITSDLFAFGLSSVGCIKLCALLSELFEKNIKVSDIFENTSVREIEKLLNANVETVDYSLREEYPLSMTQTGIYIECMRYPGSTTYNIPELHKLGGGVDIHRLAEAINKAVLAHPYLFMDPVRDKEGTVHARRRDEHPFEVPIIKCDVLPAENKLVRPFYLDHGEVLFRAEIYETKDGNYFFLDTHHIVSDGGSLDILKRDIDRAYSGETIEKEKYTGYEFALDERAARESERFENARVWYGSHFSGCGGETLPIKDGKEEDGSIGVGKIIGETDGALIRRFCEEHSYTLNAFFTTAFGLALKSYTASENAIFTTIYNGRSDARLSESVSMLVKTLPVYLECASQQKVSEAIEQCQSFLLSAMANDIYSFAEIRNAYDIKADVMFVYQGEYEHGAMIGGEFAALQTLGISRAIAGLGIEVSLDGSKVVYELEYDSSSYSEFTMKGLVRMMDIITGQFLSKKQLSEVCLTNKTDEEKILDIYDASSPYEDKPGYRHLQDSAEKYPDRTALIAIDRTLTYKELNEEANALGHVLRDNGADIETKVAVLADRNSYGYVMREGALKSGGAFMPIDPEYPEERIMYILENSGCKLLVTTKEIMDRRKELMESLSAAGVSVVDVTKAVTEGCRDNLNIDVPGEALAYVIYTSGSTGKPKGVMIENRNLANFVDDNIHNKEVRVFTKFGRVTLAIAAFTFDVSVLEEFVPLGHGQTVVLATMDQIMDAQQMRALILDNNVESMTCTPTYMLNLTEIESFAPAIRNLKSIDIGAEAFPPVLYTKLAAINPDLYICNTYGPTECSVTCTLKELNCVEDLSIGYPLSNVKLATFDRDGRLQAPGALGELVIMGNGVGRGYIGRDDLNKRNFITLMGLPAYRSGDLVRIKEDGDVEFHGRIDNQVKLRGLRVELGEIESVLGNYPGVRSCIVIVVKGETDYLAAYFTADKKVDIKDLKAHLSSYLTAYMVPQAFLQLDEMPMNLSGKIDKKALPEAVMTEDEIVPPENETQEKILQVVKEVIGDVNIGITSDLFAFGLSSVGCIKLCALLAEEFDRNLKVSEVFENSTIKAIESILGSTDESREYELREEYPLSMTQTGIYIECMRYQESTIYNIPELYKLGEGVDIGKLAKAIDRTLSAHPYLFMEPVRDKDGIVHARRRDDYHYETPVIKCDVLPAEDELVRPFALDTGEVLFRAEIYETREANYFFLDTHHIVSDGESIYILIRDISRAYDGETIEKERYTGYEFALDEEAERESERLENSRVWYDNHFKGCGGETLPVKDGKEGSGHIAFRRTAGETDADRIRAFCEEKALSINAFFVTAFGLALKSYTASENAIFTTIYNGRSNGRLSDSVSMLVKTLPVYLECTPEKEISETIEECQKFLLSAMAKDIYSFAEIRNAYDIKADIMFTYQGESEQGLKIAGEPAEQMELGLSMAKSSIAIDVSLDGSKVMYELEYDPSAYSEFTVNGLAHMMDIISGQFLDKKLLGDVSLTNKADEEKILNIYDTSSPYEDKPGYRHLQDSAEKYPDRTALIAIDRTLTYKELNEEANALGHVLRDNGADIETKVAVLADRNSYGYVMREGALKSGGAFMPIDPDYPEERIMFILEDSGCKLLVTTKEIMDRRKELMESLGAAGVTVIDVTKAVTEGSRDNLNIDVPGEALAYVIYTSGSTGKPKGVMIENRNLANFVDDNIHNKEARVFTKFGRVTLAIAAFTFDVSVLEEFVPLGHGQTVVLATMDQIMDARQMKDLILNNNVESMTCTPTYMLNLTEIESFAPAIKNLKSIDIGSEAFPPVLYTKLAAINPDLYIDNSYGPTECSVTCTLKELNCVEDLSIGYPLSNVKLATFDRDGRLQVPGALGELVIMGNGVGRGYIGRDDLNKRNFITLMGLPAYRSGDLVRIKEDGDVEFHGRIDNQVKLRGLRVELGEIESVLGNYPGIRSCIVIVAKGETDYLAAYFTADKKVDIKSLKAHLSSYLTSYMVPQAFLQLEEMPMNLSGKIDKKALPEAVMMEDEIVPPENATQEKLLEVVKEVIGDVPVGITSDLFAFGLSSVGCIKLCALLSELFEKNVKVSDIFENTSVREIEKLLNENVETVDYSLREEYPLSMTQTGIYIECMRYPGSTTYNIPELIKLGEGVDTSKLAKAIDKAVAAHPYLFMEPVGDMDGNVHARRRDDYHYETPVIRCDTLPAEDKLVRPFYLDAGELLFRAEIYETKDGNYFLLDTHHIVSDGESITILMEDIERCYLGEEVAKESYTGYEFALDEEAARNSVRLTNARNWYDSIFAGCGGEAMPVKDGDKGDNHIGEADIRSSVDVSVIRHFCDENGISLNAFFTAAFGLALKSFTCSESAVFSVIYNGRSDARLKNSVSMLVKTFPVYIEGNPEKDTLGTLKDCQRFLLSAMSNDIYSFAEIKNAYGIAGDILFAFQGEEDTSFVVGGEEAKVVELSGSRARAELGLDVFLGEDCVIYSLEYDPAVYSEYTVKSLTHMMDRVVSGLISKALVKDISLTDEDDTEKIKNLHDSTFPVKERPAYRLLQDSADKNPEGKALVATDRTMTYKELNAEANALGAVLRQKGAGPESIVAVLADRDSYAYVMRQGVLKSGGAFLPIDPEYPEDRIRFILEDSGAKLLVTKRNILDGRREMFDAIAASGVRLIAVEDAVKEGSRDNINAEVPYDALAYVIYTSGSTGKPKGVMLTNKNLVNFVDDNEKNHEISGYTRRGHVSLAIAALTFDFSIMEEFVPIANGMTVVLATHDDIMNPVMLGKLMTDNHVDVMSCTPSYLMNMLDMGEFTRVFTDAVKALRSVDMGAEAFPPALYEKLKEINPDICIMNGYGPTEATISCTMQIIEDTDNITIGIPNVNVHVATVDRDGRLQGLGALGEMVIMGDGVGRGYIGRDDLNKKNFIRLLDMPAYRSGDLVRIKENGDIEYHGRIDNQVKLRGLRVELGEIESVIGSYPGIRSTIVIVIKKETEYLAAYFTADSEINVEDLKAHLSTQLTAYMVPQAFMQLEEMPLTANGKIDKKALPEPGMQAEEVVPAENDRQQTILDMVKRIVGDVPIGITTDLFAAGLSSLGCIRLCTMLADEFDRKLTIAEILDNKTVKDIEKLLDAAAEEEEFELRKEYPLSMTQMGILVESIHYKDTTVYNMPFLYELAPETDMARLRGAVDKTLAAHPYLSMTLTRNEEGEVYAVRSEEIEAEILEGTALPPGKELIRPFDLTSGEPLCRIGLYDTDTGKYLFIDTHHILSDGESFAILMEDIESAYMGGDPEQEKFTAFEAALYEERSRNSERFEKAKEWHDSVFSGCGKVTLPPEENMEKDGETGEIVLNGEISAKEIKEFCEKNRLGLNAFFTMAMGLALKACTGAENAIFAAIYNGRSDSRLERSIGMFVKTIPVIISAEPDKEVVRAIGECQTLLVNAMAYDIFSFAEVCSTYGLSSDVLFAYQGELDDDRLLIGGKEIKEKALDTGDIQAKSPFGLDIYMQDGKVIYEFECDPAMYGNATAERFYRLMEAVVRGLLTAGTIGEVLALPMVKELSAEPASSVEDEKSTEAAAGETEQVEVDNEVKSKQLILLQKQFLEIYRKVLKNEDFGLDDNFFEYGGTSLLAAKVMMALMVKDYPVVYQDIFDEPTPRKLAWHIFSKMEEQWSQEKEPDQGLHKEDEKKAPVNSHEKALSHNTSEYVDEIRSESLGTVLLTGAAGFLGIHILKELMDSGAKKVYCLLRGGKLSAESRLKKDFFYYFDELDEDWFGKRIIALEGDITNKEFIMGLAEYDIDTVINCAASVKHFAELEFLKNVNVYGVANLVDLCLEKNCRLVHISTVSVCGERSVDSEGETVLFENSFDIGQQVESNGYVYSKYLAEKLVLDAIEEKGLDGKIIRMGNLTARYIDGEFQINFKTNNFTNTLKAYVALGCFPVQEMDEKDEFSPIDEVARATVLLAGTNKEFTVFHAYNSHTIEMGDLVQALNDNELKVDVVDETEFNERLKIALSDDRINSYVSPLVNYKTDNDENIRENDVDNAFTVKALYRLGFRWHITDMGYIDNVIDMLKTLGFFDV